ncbi:unnamed protein product [Lactuca saligna]|uniref:Uncharacterized protein n=1 Tax=Lactuca saligna TaxID=75948 RepID=A0AA35VJZ4_LACSI|nr:unnamed protein product [Lactuca saligna]
MFDDDNTFVGVISILTTIKSLQKPSSSKPSYDFDLFSSSSEEEEELNVDANSPWNQGNETKTNPVDNPAPSEPQYDDVELRDNVSSIVSKVDSLDKSLDQLDSKIDQNVTSLDSKLELILKLLFEIKEAGPSELDWENQLD